MEEKPLPGSKPGWQKAWAACRHLCRRSQSGDEEASFRCVCPFRRAHEHLAFLLCDMKLPEFPSNRSVGGKLLLKNQDPSAVMLFHFKGCWPWSLALMRWGNTFALPAHQAWQHWDPLGSSAGFCWETGWGRDALLAVALLGWDQGSSLLQRKSFHCPFRVPRPDWNLCSPPMAPLAITVVEKVRDLPG